MTMMLGMTWTTARQTMYCDDLTFTHEGPIPTHPSHDLAHLLVRACSDLPWMPEGSGMRLAEYNAVFLEHFLDAGYGSVMHALPVAAIMPTVMRYAQWFVEKHFAPFPMTAAEAYRRFSEGIDRAALVRLCPYFWGMKRQERTSGVVGTFTLSFNSDDGPVCDARFQKLVAEQIDLVL